MDSTEKWLQAFEKKVNRGLQAAAEAHAVLFELKVTEFQVEQNKRSKPGQYPFRETGIGAESIKTMPVADGWASGVTEAGIHLYYLENPGPTLSAHIGGPRKGMVDVYHEEQEFLAREFEGAFLS